MSENSVIGLGSNFNTDDKYGHQSEWYKKQIKEEAKFAFEHNFVSLEETGYDGRPIVNEARAIANGAICVLRDRGYRNMFDNFETESQEEIVDALTELAQMHIDSVLAKNNIYEQPAVDPDNEQFNTPEELEDQRVTDLNYELRHFQGIADRWGNKPGLTQLEACHGAIHDAYAVRFSGQVPQPAPVGEFHPHRVYDALYDMTYADQIKARTIRAAQDLFKD
jgi:hypothetical protein